jgi:3-oxoacyl-(acyl-carrier-protein) synthase
MRHAFITGLGFIASIGNDEASVLGSLRNQISGIEPYSFLGDGIDRSGISVAGTLKDFNFYEFSWATWQFPDRYQIKNELLRALPPHGVYSVCAVQQLMESQALDAHFMNNDRSGLFCASAGSPFLMKHYLQLLEDFKGRRGHPMSIVSTISGTLNFTLGSWLGVEGGNVGFVSACASSAHALGFALDQIRMNRIDRALIVGAEDFKAETILPFAAMKALSMRTDSTASRPWDISRDGFVGTGGSVALLLESEQAAKARRADPYAELVGWGHSSDGSSMTVSHPQGKGLARAMELALEDASISKDKVDYINAHATSTQVGDASEAYAINKVFGGKSTAPFVSSTKSLTGHGLSLSGAMEAAFTSLVLKKRFIPGNSHLEYIDPLCADLNLPKQSFEYTSKYAISNSSGFGGSNVSLVFKSV